MLLFTSMTNQNISSVTNLDGEDITLHSAYNIIYDYILILELEALWLNVKRVELFYDQHPQTV